MDYNSFKAYVVDNIKSYLPSEYENATVTLDTVTKSSDVELSGNKFVRNPSLRVI